MSPLFPLFENPEYFKKKIKPLIRDFVNKYGKRRDVTYELNLQDLDSEEKEELVKLCIPYFSLTAIMYSTAIDLFDLEKPFLNLIDLDGFRDKHGDEGLTYRDHFRENTKIFLQEFVNQAITSLEDLLKEDIDAVEREVFSDEKIDKGYRLKQEHDTGFYFWG